MDLQRGGDAGGLDPRAILPTEMWFQVLDNLVEHPDPGDLLVAAETCPIFEGYLGDQVNSHRLAQVMPFLLKWLAHGDRLNCRCLSSRVTKSVDSVLDHAARVAPNQNLNVLQSRFLAPSHLSSGNFEATYFGNLRKSIGLLWETRAKVERFHSEMGAAATKNPGSHPMIGRTLTLFPVGEQVIHGDNRAAVGKEFLEWCLQLLPDYRHAIHQLTLLGMVSDVTGTLVERYDIHRRILTALPNLYSFRETRISMVGLSRLAGIVANLGTHIAQSPMPPMRFLEEICLFDSKDPVPVPLLQEISVRYGAQLKRFECMLAADAQESGDASALVTLPSLTHLEIMNCDADRNKRPPAILMNVQANYLVDLTLIIKLSDSIPFLPEVVKYLARFPRLISLSLDMTYLLLHGQDSKGILGEARYPSVKQLKVTTQHSQFPLTFFTQLFPSLESIQFIGRFGTNAMGLDDHGEFGKDLQLLRGHRGFECEVWESCPSLNTFWFPGCFRYSTVYSRDAYQGGNQQRRQFVRHVADVDGIEND